MDEILGIFFEEASQSIEELEKLFLELCPGASGDDFKVMFRIAHNIKGSAKSVGMSNMGKITHELETLMIKLGDGTVLFSAELHGVLLEGIDALKNLLACAQQTGVDALNVESTLDKIRNMHLAPREQLFSPSVLNELAQAQDGDIIFMDSQEPVPDAVAENAQHGPVPTEDLPQLKEAEVVAKVEPVVQKMQQKNLNETVRVPTFRIDRLQNHVGEILVLQSVLAEQLRDHPSVLVRNALRQMKKVTREVQDDSMGLRLVPLKSLFVKLSRAVHDASRILSKEIEFVTLGEDTEVDKVLSEGLADPLMHMVRNAVDHGVEPAERRINAGKSSKGRIEISARAQGAFLVVTVKDDGGGLDSKIIYEKAKEKGLVGSKKYTDFTEKQIFSLIFAPGFSTKAVVTEVSGRGVGMDVVQTAVHAMRGHIEIDSILGKGTTFSITIPLAISLLDGLVVQISHEKWIIPLHMVVESFRYSSCKISSLVGVGEVLNLRNVNIPLVDLSDLLQVKQDTRHLEDRVVVVTKDKEVSLAIVVTAVLGIQTVVSKPLTPEMHARPGITGCAILGDGKTSLIVEISSLYQNTPKVRRAA